MICFDFEIRGQHGVFNRVFFCDDRIRFPIQMLVRERVASYHYLLDDMNQAKSDKKKDSQVSLSYEALYSTVSRNPVEKFLNFVSQPYFKGYR